MKPEEIIGGAAVAMIESAGFAIVPKKLTREMACAFEGCAPPSTWVHGDPHGAIDQLIADYQPEWDRVLESVSHTAGQQKE